MIPAGDKNKGTILRIQRMSTEDGPGIRSTVFFKGCPLKCTWCHNPESISPRPQVHWVKSRCIGCSGCVEACPKGAISTEQGGIAIDRSHCDSCGACVQACPSTAMETYGEVFTVSGLVDEVIKDKVYFQKSGGGVTLSGGEPTMQPVFAKELLSSFKQRGVSTALDTSGQCPWKALEELLPLADLLLYDLKEIDPENHQRFTGITNAKILDNLVKLGRFMKERGMPGELWVRTPLIPGFTATPENIQGIGAYISRNIQSVVSRWDLCTFNNLCTHKYEGLGIDWPLKRSTLLDEDQAGLLAGIARQSGVDPGIVHLSGPMKTACPYDLPDDKPRPAIGKQESCR